MMHNKGPANEITFHDFDLKNLFMGRICMDLNEYNESKFSLSEES